MQLFTRAFNPLHHYTTDCVYAKIQVVVPTSLTFTTPPHTGLQRHEVFHTSLCMLSLTIRTNIPPKLRRVDLKIAGTAANVIWDD